MMAPESMTDDLTFTELIEDLAIPCDYADDEGANPCQGEPAAWVMFATPCCSGVTTRLACTHCKDVRLHGEGAVYCGRCGAVTFPASAAYFLIEPLNKRPA